MLIIFHILPFYQDFFYKDSAKTYFQLDLNFELSGWEFVDIAIIIIIDWLWKRTSMSNTKTWLFYSAILLSLLSVWVYIHMLPTNNIFTYIQQIKPRVYITKIGRYLKNRRIYDG